MDTIVGCVHVVLLSNQFENRGYSECTFLSFLYNMDTIFLDRDVSRGILRFGLVVGAGGLVKDLLKAVGFLVFRDTLSVAIRIDVAFLGLVDLCTH